MRTSADLGGCNLRRPSASVDTSLLDLQSSSYPTQRHSIIANYGGRTQFSRAFLLMQFSARTRIVKNKHAVNRVIIFALE